MKIELTFWSSRLILRPGFHTTSDFYKSLVKKKTIRLPVLLGEQSSRTVAAKNGAAQFVCTRHRRTAKIPRMAPRGHRGAGRARYPVRPDVERSPILWILQPPLFSLPVTTKKEVALDVFIKIDTSGVELSVFDIIVAQVEAGMGKSLHDLVGDLRAASPVVTDYYPADDLVLYASALLQGRAPTNATYMAKDFGSRLLENRGLILDGVGRTVSFLEEERIFDVSRLPSDVVVPVLVALWSLAPKGLDQEGKVRTILRKYLWRAFFSNRYESSTNSRALADFNELKPLVTGVEFMKLPAIFDDSLHPIAATARTDRGWLAEEERSASASC